MFILHGVLQFHGVLQSHGVLVFHGVCSHASGAGCSQVLSEVTVEGGTVCKITNYLFPQVR